MDPSATAIRDPLLAGHVDDAVLRVERVSEDGRSVFEDVSGADDAESLIEEGGHAVSIELGSDDGHTSAMVFSVRPIEERPADFSVLPRRVSIPARGIESEDDVVRRILDGPLVDVAARIAPADDTSVEVLVTFDEIPQEPIAAVVAREQRMLHLNEDEERSLRGDVVARRFEEIRALQAPALHALEVEVGAEILDSFVVSNTAFVRVDRNQLRKLALLRGVRHVEENRPLRPLSVDGWEAVRAAQVEQYINAGNTGNRANPSRHSRGRITLGIMEYDAISLNAAFEDDFESIGNSRISERWNCLGYGGATCSTVANFYSYMLPQLGFIPDSRHATAVTQIATGRAPTPDSYRNPRSGSSREATLVLLTAHDTDDYLRGLNRIALSVVDIESSSLATDSDFGCGGTTSVASAVNDLSRIYGTLFIQAAGNSHHVDPSACTLADPAGATYAFPVGGLLDTATVSLPASDYLTVQSGAIWIGSSRGNVPYLGGYRSVIGTTAVASQMLLPDHMPNLYTNIGNGTSFAAPLIAGAAVDMRDWWLLNGPGSFGYGTGFMNDPGFTYVQLLLMGDRVLENGTRTKTGFDGLFGNGRFRARKFDTSGMDDPWKAQVSAFYISEGAISTFHINGGLALAAGVDRLVAAIWWPESNYPGGADITMAVRQTCGTGSFTRDDSSYDNKKRVFIDGSDTAVAGRCWAIDLRAYTVPASSWQGGLHRRYVYLAYYYEDEARDDLAAGIQ
jgi:hypothetical protein